MKRLACLVGCLLFLASSAFAQFTGGGSGGSGTVTSVDASGGVETASGSAITSTGTIRGAELVNAQTGTTYTYLTGDRGKLVTHTNAAAIAGTLPQASASFPSGWYMDVQNRGAGTLTITPTTSTIDGAASLALTTAQGVRIVSDGTNYFTQRGIGSSSGAPSTATYITQTADGGLSAEQALSALATGCMGSTTTTGVVATRTITGTANQITVTNGDCSAAPTISIPTNPTLPGNVSVTGTLTIGSGAGPAIFDMLEGTAPGANATAAHHNVYVNSTGSVLESHEQGGTVKTYAYQGGDVGAATGTTPSANDNDTSLATTAYVQTELTAYASDTVTLTNKTIDCEGTGNACTIVVQRGGDLVGVAGGTTGHVWNDDPLSTACTPLAVTGTNQSFGVCTFPDSDGEIGRSEVFLLPTGWGGSMDADITWKTTGTGNARFRIQTICYATDEAMDSAFSNSTYVTAAAGTSGRINKVNMPSIVTTGCAAGERMIVRFSRNRTEASDTINAALDVEKVLLNLRVTQ